ncbi:hypothetical protein GYB22_00960 [bacterium]|nr:hypothetical protein [bacterium]
MCLSCKDDTPAVRVYDIEPVVAEYGNFKENTLWVYLDSISGVKDTMSLVTINVDTTDLNINRHDKVRSVAMSCIIESLSDGERFLYFTAGHSGAVQYGRMFENSEEFHPAFSTTIFRRGSKDGDRWINGVDELNYSKLTGIHDSLKLFSHVYYDVYEVYNEENLALNRNETITFTARNFGVVRIQNLTSNEDWILLEMIR